MDSHFKRCKIFQEVEKLIPKNHQFAWAAVLALIFVFAFYSYQAFGAYRSAKQIKGLSPKIQESLVNRDFAETKLLLGLVNRNILEMESYVDRMYPINHVPKISSEFDAIYSVIGAAKASVYSGFLVSGWLEGLPIVSKTNFSSIDELKEPQRRQILKHFVESADLWDSVSANTKLALEFLSDAQRKTTIPVFSGAIMSEAEKIESYHKIFEKVEPWISAAPEILGYPNEKTYLLLLQNNTELRPTGGFIGTYGILKIRNATVTSFMTDNVYNLDEPAKAYNTKIPPLPMQKYIKQSQWFFRDSNWDPDFPSTARRAIQFYKDEQGKEKRFDGVIAFTPELVEDILSIVGPVHVDDTEFTADNLVDVLAFHVEKGFSQEGITIYNRKRIIDDMARKLKDKIFSLSVEQLRRIFPILMANFEKKHLMVWFSDASLQKIAEELDWGNRVLPSKADYLYVVDANLGSLKSDPAVNRSIDYTMSITDDGKFLSKASITYEHTGDFDWKTTRYRTYTRIYVPKGSTLVNTRGNEEEISVGDEHGKTVFGTFISIEPSDTETLSFTYVLPEDVESEIQLNNYNLLVQKQAGTISHALNIDITVPFSINSVHPDKILTQQTNNRVIGNWDLSSDREFVITQK